MQNLIQAILTQIVDYPEDVHIDLIEDETGFVTITASVNPEDMGKVIGKNGRIINSIRKIIKIKAIKLGKRFSFQLTEPQNQ